MINSIADKMQSKKFTNFLKLADGLWPDQSKERHQGFTYEHGNCSLSCNTTKSMIRYRTSLHSLPMKEFSVKKPSWTYLLLNQIWSYRHRKSNDFYASNVRVGGNWRLNAFRSANAACSLSGCDIWKIFKRCSCKIYLHYVLYSTCRSCAISKTKMMRIAVFVAVIGLALAGVPRHKGMWLKFYFKCLLCVCQLK